MTADPLTNGKVFLLDRAKKRSSKFASLHVRVISSRTELRDSISHATKDTMWICYSDNLTEALVKTVSWPRSTLGLGLFLHPLDLGTIPALTSCFRRIAFASDGGFLPPEELAEVLQSENRSELFLGGSVDKATETITLWRGNLAPLTVPFTAFQLSGAGIKPDFHKFAIIDSGQTVQLGEYEAATDALLYEYDPEHRRQLGKKRLQEDQSFGASLRRLRKQRGLRRQDFEPDVAAKTIARIEQGKVKRIHKKTLAVLAQRLAVQPHEIETF